MLKLEDLTDEETRLLLQRLIEKTPSNKTIREFFDPEEIAYIAEQVVRETRGAQGI